MGGFQLMVDNVNQNVSKELLPLGIVGDVSRILNHRIRELELHPTIILWNKSGPPIVKDQPLILSSADADALTVRDFRMFEKFVFTF